MLTYVLNVLAYTEGVCIACKGALIEKKAKYEYKDTTGYNYLLCRYKYTLKNFIGKLMAIGSSLDDLSSHL